MQNQGPPAPSAGGTEINWITTFFMAAFHIGAIAALFFLPGRLSSSQLGSGGYREALASGWVIIGCSHIVATELQSGSSIF
jgi:hypothetical protein